MRRLWICLFLIRAAGLFIGLDRLPMVPTVNPEVIINDPAVSLSRGHGFVAYSFEHSVNGLDRLYAHFPPVFIALQALVFRIFGFSAVSLRALSVICDLLTCLVFLLILRELRAKGIVDRLGATIAGVLIVLEPTAMIHAREARMESLNTLLGAVAFLLCVRAGERFALWLGAGFCIGLALATHPAAALMWVALEVWTLLEFRRLGIGRWIAVNALPPAVLIAAGLIVYGRRAGDAVAQLRHLSLFGGPPSLRVPELLQALAHGSAAAAQNAGGLGLIFTMLILPWALWRVISERFASKPLVALLAIVVIQLALLQFLIPTSGMNRAVMIFPFALVCGGASISHLGGASVRKLVTLGALAAVLQAGMIAAYLGQLRHSWRERRPCRFDELVSAVPPSARVAGPPELWFAFRHKDRPFTVIYRAMGEDEYWETPHAFDAYDVVILDPNWPRYAAWRAKAQAARPDATVIHTYARDFLVLSNSLTINPASVAR